MNIDNPNPKRPLSACQLIDALPSSTLSGRLLPSRGMIVWDMTCPHIARSLRICGLTNVLVVVANQARRRFHFHIMRNCGSICATLLKIPRSRHKLWKVLFWIIAGMFLLWVWMWVGTGW